MLEKRRQNIEIPVFLCVTYVRYLDCFPFPVYFAYHYHFNFILLDDQIIYFNHFYTIKKTIMFAAPIAFSLRKFSESRDFSESCDGVAVSTKSKYSLQKKRKNKTGRAH